MSLSLNDAITITGCTEFEYACKWIYARAWTRKHDFAKPTPDQIASVALAVELTKRGLDLRQAAGAAGSFILTGLHEEDFVRSIRFEDAIALPLEEDGSSIPIGQIFHRAKRLASRAARAA